MNRRIPVYLVVTLTVVMQIGTLHATEVQQTSAMNTDDVAHHYTQLAYEMFSDALVTAKQLQQDITAFIAAPNQETHARVKQAWIKAHSVYSQTEVFRFGNPNVDAWEGQVNAWPMDEGLVDYVATEYQYEEGNPHALENIIASNLEISEQSLRTMHEKAGSEANVATGYHAIEFLLWGQDLNETPRSAGTRSYTDYLQDNDCTNPPCNRRAKYLLTLSKMLLDDISKMIAQWNPQTGSYIKEFLALSSNEQLRRILFGMGGLSLGELAGERIRVALLANAQEDEQSCFSDTTAIAIYNNTAAIRNVYVGYYLTSDGREIEGASVSDLVKLHNPDLHVQLTQQLALSIASAYEILDAADRGEPFDQQILASNKKGNERLQQMIDRLRNQTSTIERISVMLTAL